MSHATLTAKLSYVKGSFDAATKLGVEAVPFIRTKLRDTEVDLGADKRMQECWLDIDNEPKQTGEESSLSLPNKTGSITTDATRGMPADKRNRYLESAIEEAFQANEDIDNSTCPEPAGKTAGDNPYSVGSSLRSSIKAPSMAFNQLNPMEAPKMPKVTDIRSNKPPGMNLQHDLATTAMTADSNTSWGSPQKRMQGYPGQ